MKQAILLHGTGGNDKDYFWFADTKKYLEEKGYQVWWPALPNPERPVLQQSLEFFEQNMPAVDEETIVIGHSSACPLILTWLQYLTISIKQAVLVAGFYEPIDEAGQSALMLPKDGWNFEAIKEHTQQLVIINSDNDPWNCNDKQARPIAEKLGATFVLMEGQGHMGSLTFNQPYREFPELKNLLTV